MSEYKLIISLSNGIQCSGVMSVDFAKYHFGNMFNNSEIHISIMKFNQSSGSLTKLYERIDGEWKEYSIDL